MKKVKFGTYFSYFCSKTYIVGTRLGGSNVYPQSMFWAKIKNIKNFPLKIIFNLKKISVYCMGMFS